MENSDWFKVKNIEQIDSPALLIYKDRVKKNVDTVIEMVGDISKLRPHVKTNKAKEPTLLMIRAGINKFKCATIAEAEMLAEVGAQDILLAYQLSLPKAKRFISLIKKFGGIKFSCLVDNVQSAKEIDQEAKANNIVLSVFIDINVGMNRTGIQVEEALNLYEAVLELKGLQLLGLHAYDGHIRNKNIEERERVCDLAFESVMQLKNQIIEKGYPVPMIVAGGTPTFPIHARRDERECGPGTFIYWDKGYQDALPEQKFLHAALVLSRVVSLPSETKVCLDLGHKSIASENLLENRVFFLNAPDFKFVGHSEEHLVVEVGQGHSYKVGDVLYGLPFHICPTCALYERAVLIENGEVTGEWKMVARDRMISV